MAKATKDRKSRPKPAAARKPKPAAKKKPAPSVKKPSPQAKKPAPPAKKPAPAPVKVAPAPTPAPAPVTEDRPKPKGISIVGKTMAKKPKVKKPIVMPNLGAPLLKPGAKKPKPLIASGPNAPSTNGVSQGLDRTKFKTPFNKKELDRFREILLRKRAELVGDVRTMEGEALQGSSGSLSHLPQHVADQGSDAYDQSLSLGLAQVDRNLIKEIDDALGRIAAGTFGVCEVTGKAISAVRLEELPWTRVSIEGARERERRSHM